MNYLGSVFKEKDTKIYYTDNEQKKNIFNMHTHTHLCHIHTTSLKKSTAQLHNYTHAYAYSLIFGTP